MQQHQHQQRRFSADSGVSGPDGLSALARDGALAPALSEMGESEQELCSPKALDERNQHYDSAARNPLLKVQMHAMAHELEAD